MKCLFFHVKTFHTEVVGLARRPIGILPEEVNDATATTDAADAIAVFVTIEQGDDLSVVLDRCAKDVQKIANETNVSRVILCPFAHLSHRLASSQTALEALEKIERSLSGDLEIRRVHFGSDKSLMMDIYGHEGNIRYREY